MYIVAEARLAALPGAVPKQKKDKKKAAAADGTAEPAGFTVLAKFKGAELVSGSLIWINTGQST